MLKLNTIFISDFIKVLRYKKFFYTSIICYLKNNSKCNKNEKFKYKLLSFKKGFGVISNGVGSIRA